MNQPVGYNHEFPFEHDKIQVAEDLVLEGFSGAAIISRTPQGLLVQADFDARLDLECVRCLDAYPQHIHFELAELFAFDERSVTDSGLILPDDMHIDLQPLVRDFALLEVPINPVCRPDCRGLCQVCGEDRNKVDCGHSVPSGDEPFSVLKDLLKDE